MLVNDLAGLNPHPQLGPADRVVGQKPDVGVLPGKPAALDLLRLLGPVAQLPQMLDVIVSWPGHCDLIEPGLVRAPLWRPDDPRDAENAQQVAVYGGVGHIR